MVDVQKLLKNLYSLKALFEDHYFIMVPESKNAENATVLTTQIFAGLNRQGRRNHVARKNADLNQAQGTWVTNRQKQLTIEELDHAATGDCSVHLRIKLLQYNFGLAAELLSPCVCAPMKNAADAIQLPS